MNRLLTGISSGALSIALTTGAFASDVAPAAEGAAAAQTAQNQNTQQGEPATGRQTPRGGVNTIYIRGLASTTPNLTTAGVAGLAPNVSLYLDEQPLAQPGRNLDVYAADLERIEVLKGPQGTLFGASSQAGVVRLITNKPSLAGFDASFTAGTSFTKDGEQSYKAEAMLNVPVTNNLAVRGVVYLDDQGGYIDNVQGTRSLRDSARFRPEGTVRDNGVPVSSSRAGFQSDAASLAYIDNNVTFIDADNSTLVEDNFNDTQYSGFRVSALYELTPDWKVTVAHTRQGLDSEGVFFADPDLDLSTGFRFHPGEVAISAFFRVLQVAALGITPRVYLAYEFVFQLATFFHHSNLRLPMGVERVLNWAIVTPRMHGIHHSNYRDEADSNYSVVFSVWDRVHGSLRLGVPQDAVIIGVPAYAKGKDNALLELLAIPFKRQRDYWRTPTGERLSRE